MPPTLDLKLLIRYSGLKATQHFSKFTDRSISVLKDDLIALGLPHPKVAHTSLLSHGLVQCYWPSARKDHVLHKNLLVKINPPPAMLQSLSIANLTLKETHVSSPDSQSPQKLKRPYSHIEQHDPRPNKLAKTQPSNDSGPTRTMATPLAKEQMVNDFLHNLLSEKLTPTPPVTASQPTHSQKVPATVSVPTPNPEGIPGLNIPRAQITRQYTVQLPTPPSSAPLVNPPQQQPASSLPPKPATPQPALASQPAPRINGPSSTTEKPHPSKMFSYARFDPYTNRYTSVHYAPKSDSSTPPPPPPRAPRPLSASATSLPDSANKSSPRPPPTNTRLASTSQGLSQASNATPPPVQGNRVLTPPVVVNSQEQQQPDTTRFPYATIYRPMSSASLPFLNRHQPTVISQGGGGETDKSTGSGSVTTTPKPDDPNRPGGLPKDLCHLMQLSQTSRKNLQQRITKDSEIIDEIRKVGGGGGGSDWVPKKIELVQLGTKTKAIENQSEIKRLTTELEVLKSELSRLQKEKEEESLMLVDERTKRERGDHALLALKKRMEEERVGEAKKLEEERKRRVRAEDEEKEIKLKLEGVRKLRMEEAKLLVDEKKRRQEAESAEVEMKMRLEAVQACNLQTQASLEILKAKLEIERRVLGEERRRRDEVENALADVRRECQRPFVVPSLLDTFVELSKLTTRGLRLVGEVNAGSVAAAATVATTTTMMREGRMSSDVEGGSQSSVDHSPIEPLVGVEVPVPCGTTTTSLATVIPETRVRVKQEPLDPTILL